MSRRLLWLAIGVVALAAFLFLWDLPRERQETERRKRERSLLDFSVDEVESLRIRRPSETVLLARPSEDRWELLSPRREPAVLRSVRGQLEQLLAAEIYRSLGDTLGRDELAVLGLWNRESGRVDLSLVLDDGTRLGLEVGRLVPEGDLCYVRRSGDADVLLVEATVHQLAHVGVDAYRDYDLFDVADSSIVAVDLQAGRMGYRGVRDAHGVWFLDEVGGQKLRRVPLEGLAYDLATARIRQFVRDDLRDGDWFAYGLREPFADLRFETVDGSVHRIRIGNEAEEELVYARRDAASSLLLIPPQLLARVQTPLAELIDRNPIVQNFARLDSLRIWWEEELSLGVVWQQGAWVPRLPARSNVDPEMLRVSIRNFLMGLEGFQPRGEVLVARGNPVDELFERKPVRIHLYWPWTSLSLRLGWAGNGEEHLVQLDDERVLHRIDRDLFLRCRALLVGAELLEP